MNDLSLHFSQLHHRDALLVLPTAWDAASARLAEQAGAPAVGTSSAALAWSCGHADGGALLVTDLLQRVAEIVHAIRIPLTVDIEDGYSDDPARVADLAVALADLGVAGINIEDGSQPPELLCTKIAAIRAALGGRPLFVNARTDVFLRGLAEGDEAVTETIARLQRYAQAGADGGFVPGLIALESLDRIASAVALPLNTMWVPGIGSHRALREVGVRRLSAGPALALHAWNATHTAAAGFLGDALAPPETITDYAAMNQLFERT